ncbi:hypothetical protein HYV12_00375 [Candidatus Dojkabacteria bacterium]|nr:hypothetical protein [Candidatus Dojkabacteria bacterium]
MKNSQDNLENNKVETQKSMEEPIAKPQTVVESTKPSVDTPPSPSTMSTNGPGQSIAERKQRSGVISELKQLQQDVKHFRASDLVVPILSIIFLALLTIFVYTPMIIKAVEFRKEKDEIAQKITKLDNLSTEVGKIDVGQLQKDLAVSREVIPFSLQVSDFILYVNNLAEDKKLDFKEILAGDIQVRSKNEQRSVDPVIKGVSGPLKYSGPLPVIVEFLDELQNVSPFIISADSVEIKKLPDTNDWELSLIITGYYLNKASLPKLDIYMPFASYTFNTHAMDVFRAKAEALEQ